MSRRFVDVTERGHMVFSNREFRWENKGGALVRLSEHATIGY